jgi:DNA-binding beta-propeller fold protein YncE
LTVALLVPGVASAATMSLWASDSGGGTSSLYELDPTTGAVLSSLPGPGLFADALSFTNDGNFIWVLDSSTNSTVYRIDLAGTIQQQFDVALDAEGLTVLQDNSLVIGGGVSGVIANIDSNTGAVISSFGVANQVFGLASNGVDRIYGLRINGIIDTYDLAGNLLGSLVTGAAGVTLGLAYTGSGFYIASTGSTIYQVDLAGAVVNSFAGPGVFTEGLDFPQIQQQQQPVPEPATLLLLGTGLAAARFRRRRRV